jgi:hypothetical protein
MGSRREERDEGYSPWRQQRLIKVAEEIKCEGGETGKLGPPST